MKTSVQRYVAILGLSTALLYPLGACAQPPEVEAKAPFARGGELVSTWNETVLRIAEAEDGFLTLKGVRTAAMMHTAMHDALNAIRPRYEGYTEIEAGLGVDPTAALAQTAYEVVVDQYPDEKPALTAELERWLSTLPESAATTAGVELGQAAAAAILKARDGDGWDRGAEYQWHPMAPGVYAEFEEHSGTPKGFVFGAGWAQATPFLLDDAAYFRTPPPPPIESDAYTEAFDEVKRVGSATSSVRTTDETHLALWWKDFAENSQNRLARQLVAEDGLDGWEAARMFALLNTTLFDAYVNVFDNKFFYNHWRPYTAIRWAEHDGNPDTQAAPYWNNTHGHTYAFPSYPSAHGTACAAALTVLAATFGEARAFTMTTESVDEAGPGSPKKRMEPATRSFTSPRAAAVECGLSRVYLGIHFRYDSVAGVELGEQIGRFALDQYFTPKVTNRPTNL